MQNYLPPPFFSTIYPYPSTTTSISSYVVYDPISTTYYSDPLYPNLIHKRLDFPTINYTDPSGNSLATYSSFTNLSYQLLSLPLIFSSDQQLQQLQQQQQAQQAQQLQQQQQAQQHSLAKSPPPPPPTLMRALVNKPLQFQTTVEVENENIFASSHSKPEKEENLEATIVATIGATILELESLERSLSLLSTQANIDAPEKEQEQQPVVLVATAAPAGDGGAEAGQGGPGAEVLAGKAGVGEVPALAEGGGAKVGGAGAAPQSEVLAEEVNEGAGAAAKEEPGAVPISFLALALVALVRGLENQNQAPSSPQPEAEAAALAGDSLLAAAGAKVDGAGAALAPAEDGGVEAAAVAEPPPPPPLATEQVLDAEVNLAEFGAVAGGGGVEAAAGGGEAEADAAKTMIWSTLLTDVKQKLVVVVEEEEVVVVEEVLGEGDGGAGGSGVEAAAAAAVAAPPPPPPPPPAAGVFGAGAPSAPGGAGEGGPAAPVAVLAAEAAGAAAGQGGPESDSTAEAGADLGGAAAPLSPPAAQVFGAEAAPQSEVLAEAVADGAGAAASDELEGPGGAGGEAAASDDITLAEAVAEVGGQGSGSKVDQAGEVVDDNEEEKRDGAAAEVISEIIEKAEEGAQELLREVPIGAKGTVLRIKGIALYDYDENGKITILRDFDGNEISKEDNELFNKQLDKYKNLLTKYKEGFSVTSESLEEDMKDEDIVKYQKLGKERSERLEDEKRKKFVTNYCQKKMSLYDDGTANFFVGKTFDPLLSPSLSCIPLPMFAKNARKAYNPYAKYDNIMTKLASTSPEEIMHAITIIHDIDLAESLYDKLFSSTKVSTQEPVTASSAPDPDPDQKTQTLVRSHEDNEKFSKEELSAIFLNWNQIREKLVEKRDVLDKIKKSLETKFIYKENEISNEEYFNSEENCSYAKKIKPALEDFQKKSNPPEAISTSSLGCFSGIFR
jgi:hypothetical protein